MQRADDLIPGLPLSGFVPEKGLFPVGDHFSSTRQHNSPRRKFLLIRTSHGSVAYPEDIVFSKFRISLNDNIFANRENRPDFLFLKIRT